jgi:signal transduction histidine kinase
MEVIDTGTGISNDNIKKLFKVLYRIEENNNNVNETGIGLGLSICKLICEGLGGWIKVCSTVGLGTKFTFGVLLEKVKLLKDQNKYMVPDEHGESVE